jgi:hypothetical protein
MKVVLELAKEPLDAIIGNTKETENRLGRAPSPTIFALNSATLNAIVFSYFVLFIKLRQRLL